MIFAMVYVGKEGPVFALEQLRHLPQDYLGIGQGSVAGLAPMRGLRETAVSRARGARGMVDSRHALPKPATDQSAQLLAKYSEAARSISGLVN